MILFILSLPVIEKNEDGHIPYSAETKNGKQFFSELNYFNLFITSLLDSSTL